jgi:hypothetical protein
MHTFKTTCLDCGVTRSSIIFCYCSSFACESISSDKTTDFAAMQDSRQFCGAKHTPDAGLMRRPACYWRMSKNADVIISQKVWETGNIILYKSLTMSYKISEIRNSK